LFVILPNNPFIVLIKYYSLDKIPACF